MTKPDDLDPTQVDPRTGANGQTIWEFFMACHDGNLDMVLALSRQYPLLIHAGIHYHQPLHFALRENHLDVAKHLLDLGADPFSNGFTYGDLRVLLEERNRSEAIELLDSTIARTHSATKHGDPLASLIKARDLPAIRQLIDQQPQLVHIGDSNGTLPLHWAVMTRQLHVIDLLLAHGAEIDKTRPDGARPIHLTNGDYHYRGWRDVPASSLRPHHVLIGYLLAKGAYYDISTAARLGDLERVRFLVEEDPQRVNQLPAYHGFYNSAPLRNAAGQGHLAVVEYLLEHGADPSLPEPIASHGTALRDALGNEHWQIAKLLLEHGANPNSMVDSSGNCVWAAKVAPEEIRQLLADKGGILGLDLACYDHNYSYVEETLKQSPDSLIHPYLPLEDKQMVELVLRYQPDVLKKKSLPATTTIEHAVWLLDRGMSPSLPNWLGVTPLHECARRGNIELAQLCIQRGSPTNPIDDHCNETPLQWAHRFHQPAFANLFG